MAREANTEVEGVNGGDYQRLYLPTRLTSDSQYPYEAGDGVRVELVSTDCGRVVPVVVPASLEVNLEASVLSLTRPRDGRQSDLSEVAPEQ